MRKFGDSEFRMSAQRALRMRQAGVTQK